MNASSSRRGFKRFLAAILLVAAAAILAGLGLSTWIDARDKGPEGVSPIVTPAGLTRVQRGEYLTQAADCAACHTVPGGKPFAGGLPLETPFGAIHSTNITPDKDTGIGLYTDDQFVAALHRGVRRDGQLLYPAFPYTAYSRLTRQDALDIKAYLFTQPAVSARPPQNTLAFPFNQRWGMRFWNLAFHHPRPYAPVEGLTEQENRGQYLATALGHCGECHTPRNVAFALKKNQEFAGAVLEDWRAYNITPDKTYGVGGWSDQKLQTYLRTGFIDGHMASGKMAEAIDVSLKHLTPDDTAALVAYLRKVKPRATGIAPVMSTAATKASSVVGPGADEPESTGRRIFAGACASCHAYTGEGGQIEFTALTGMRSVADPQSLNMVQVILHGNRIPGAPASMPGFAKGYSDADIAAVANYVARHFGDHPGKVTPAQVARMREAM